MRSPALFITALGEIASAYVAIAVSSRVKRMRNGDLSSNQASGRWTGLLGIATAKAEQSTVVRGKELQQKARLLYEVRVALKLHPEPPGGG